MVSNYSDAGQERWLAAKGIDLLRGTGRLAGVGVVQVDGVPHTAGNIVLATGSDPIVPPVPGMVGLEGIWTNREVTGMTSVPRRLLILGGGPVEPRWPRQCSGSVVRWCSSKGPNTCWPGNLRRWDLRWAMCSVARESNWCWGFRQRGLRRDGADFVLALEDGREDHGDHLLIPPVGAPAWTGSAWRQSASTRTSTAFPSMPDCVSVRVCGRSATSPACDY